MRQRALWGLALRASSIVLGLGLGFAAMAAFALAGEPVREYTDESTAATITVAEVALVFARERTDLAVNARDYLTLAPLEINRGGQRSYFWLGYVWSTIDRRDGDVLDLVQDEFVVIADGRPLRLVREARSLREHGVAERPLRAPVKGAVMVLFPADPEIFNFASDADSVELRRIRQDVSETYLLWRDSRENLRAFLRHLELDQP